MLTNEVSSTITDNNGNSTTPQIDKVANLALAKSTFLGLDKSTSLEGASLSLSPLGYQEEEENSSTESTDCPSDEGTHEMTRGGSPQDFNRCNGSPLHDRGNSTKALKESDTECEAIEQVSRILGEMANILDESVCSSTSTSKDASDSTASNAPEQPKLPIKLSLLRQIANINSSAALRDIDAAGDGQSALVEGNILIETIEMLFAERTEMIQEVLSLLEAAREETKALRDLPRYNANDATSTCVTVD